MESTVKVPATCDEMRDLIGKFLKRGDSEAQRLWDIITCQRGPDHPSEDGTMANNEASEAYQARRKRKRDTVEVIRAKSWGGVVGGCARYRTDIDYVTVEPPNEQDHFARHVVKAADALGLEVKFKKPRNEKGIDVPVKVGYSEGTGATSSLKFKPTWGAKKVNQAIKPPVSYPAWTLAVKPLPLVVKDIGGATKTVKENPNWKGAGVYVVTGLDAFTKSILFVNYAEDGTVLTSHQFGEGSDVHMQWTKDFAAYKMNVNEVVPSTVNNSNKKEDSSSPF